MTKTTTAKNEKAGNATGLGVSVSGLGRSFGGTRVVDDISFDVPEGEFLSIVGPSGCGKSTTLRMLAGLERADSGEIRIGGELVTSVRDGVFVPAEERGVGFVFQSYALWPHLTVYEHVAYPLRTHRIADRDVRRRVGETLEIVGLGPMRARYPSELSGGQQQRVALARALVMEPATLLLDEPLSNLDAGLRARMGRELRTLQRELGFTAVYVTHDRVEALSLSDRVMVMLDGHAVEFGSPVEIYEHPRGLFSATFVSGANMFEGAVESIAAKRVVVLTADGARIEVARTEYTPDVAVRDAVLVAARPETLEIGRTFRDRTNVIPATVTTVSYYGAYSEVELGVATGQVVARVEPRDALGLRAGESVDLRLRPETLAVVRAESGSPTPLPAIEKRE